MPVEVKAGSLVLLHGANVHRSGENTSPQSRHAYAMVRGCSLVRLGGPVGQRLGCQSNVLPGDQLQHPKGGGTVLATGVRALG